MESAPDAGLSFAKRASATSVSARPVHCRAVEGFPRKATEQTNETPIALCEKHHAIPWLPRLIAILSSRKAAISIAPLGTISAARRNTSPAGAADGACAIQTNAQKRVW